VVLVLREAGGTPVTYLSSVYSNFKIAYFTYTSPCDLFTIKWLCDMYKSLCYICLLGFTLSHACMCIERTIATFLAKNYEQKGAKYGILLTIFIVSYSILL
jgi:hypothetical protein